MNIKTIKIKLRSWESIVWKVQMALHWTLKIKVSNQFLDFSHWRLQLKSINLQQFKAFYWIDSIVLLKSKSIDFNFHMFMWWEFVWPKKALISLHFVVDSICSIYLFSTDSKTFTRASFFTITKEHFLLLENKTNQFKLSTRKLRTLVSLFLFRNYKSHKGLKPNKHLLTSE